MSTPAPADARLLAASQKQLEELDALLERMLQLPVVEEEPLPIVESSGWHALSNAKGVDSQPNQALHSVQGVPPSGACPEAQNSESDAEPSQDIPPADELPEEPALAGWHALSNAKGVDLEPNHALHFVQGVPPNKAPSEPQHSQSAEDQEPRRVRPILACILAAPNWLFDQATLPLGGVGRWLRGEQGRTLLGFTGLALLAAAAVVGVLDWILGNW